jgi:glycosyltransferase involved in cell wall biosynthesis
MNILHTDFHRGWGGQASRILMVCRRLAERGERVLIAAPPGELSMRAREAGLDVDDGFSFRPPSHLPAFVADVRRLGRLLRDRSIDILHTHGSQDTWAGAAARTLTGRPAIFLATRHNTKRIRFNAANRWLYGKALDHLVLAAGGIREQLRPFLDAGLVGEERLSVVHSAYRTDRFVEGIAGHDGADALGVAGRRPLLGVMARLARDKGHTHLFAAMESIRARHPGALLLVAGMGPDEKELREEVDARGLGGSVRFLGFRDDIPEITSLLDVAVLPSVGCDASSASIKEAMAMGCPVVATDIGGAREILRDGETGRIVAPGDPQALASAILALLDDPAASRAMGEAARSDVRARFSPERLGDGIAAVYERLTDRRGIGAPVARPTAAGPAGGRP